ncbi:MAG: hypothetical protein DA408_08515 [Bacteroidetes bacterium]|nr:MAG: hypothetical protein DA408_08515 [Bacteroidota bacterium]
MQTIPAIYLGISRSKTEVHLETPRLSENPLGKVLQIKDLVYYLVCYWIIIKKGRLIRDGLFYQSG